MKALRKMLDQVEPLFHKGGPLEKLYAQYEMIDTFLYTPGQVTKGPTHLRDSIDLKRTMITVVAALVPCIFMAMWNEAKQTSIMDCMPIFYSLVKVGGGLVVFGSGNPLIWGGAWYANKRYKAMMEEWTNQERLAELEKKKRLKIK